MADGATAETTFDAYCCILHRIRIRVGDVPVAMITVIPMPLRWSIWPEVEKFHRLVIELSQKWPGLHVVDGLSAHLATGAPPDTDVFLPDLLHLKASGYAHWNQQAHAALDDFVTAKFAPAVMVRGGRYVVYFGSVAGPAADGARTMVAFPTERGLTAGERWRLVDDKGRSGPRLVVADWNLMPTPDGQALCVRPSTFAHLTLEGVEKGTPVTVTIRPAGPVRNPVTRFAVADDHARVHLHPLDVNDPPREVVGIDIVVGG